MILQTPIENGSWLNFCQARVYEDGYVCEIRIYHGKEFCQMKPFAPDAEGRVEVVGANRWSGWLP